MIDCLNKGSEQSVQDIVKVIYADYPVALHKPAEGSITLHLRKLQDEGKVVKSKEDRYSLTAKKATL